MGWETGVENTCEIHADVLLSKMKGAFYTEWSKGGDLQILRLHLASVQNFDVFAFFLQKSKLQNEGIFTYVMFTAKCNVYMRIKDKE